MTGAEHYREAERLIREARGIDSPTTARADTIAIAQVHATLAHAAASALAVAVTVSLAEDQDVRFDKDTVEQINGWWNEVTS